jgi:putative ABC transport system ATP-binding protein
MVRLEKVNKVFQVGDGQVHALRDVDLEIGRGEYLSIMGPSGSGKSTLLNILGLLDRPSAGRYAFEDRDVTALSESESSRVRRERIGFVFQFFHLIPRLTARENIELPLVLNGVPPRERAQKVGEALEAFGLADRAEHRPNQLSGGQRQRVAIARATIQDPVLLMADEPTGNLDQQSGKSVLELLESLWKRGLTLVVVTHDPEIGIRAERRIRMSDGRIVEDARGEARR